MSSLFQTHFQLGRLPTRQVIAKATNSVVTVFPGGCAALNVRLPDLKMIDHVIHVEFSMSPLNCAQPIYEAVNKRITGNVVGMTIMGAAFGTGTTVTAEVVAIGL